jgi:uncharacterized membrane protein YvbJ
MLKCSHCGQWNTTTENQSHCSYCGNEFFSISAAEEQSLARRETAGDIKIKINESDNAIVVFFKQTFNFVQMVFLAIVSFIVWFVAAGPG